MKTLYPHEAELRTFLGQRFETDLSALPLDASLTEKMDLDSLAGLELMAEIEDEFGVYFTEEHLSEQRTLRHILEALSALGWRAAS